MCTFKPPLRFLMRQNRTGWSMKDYVLLPHEYFRILFIIILYMAMISFRDALYHIAQMLLSLNTPQAFSQTQRIRVASLRQEAMALGMKNTYKTLPTVADPYYDPSCFSNRSQIEFMGYTVRSSQWRFTQWVRWNGKDLCPLPPTTVEVCVASIVLLRL